MQARRFNTVMQRHLAWLLWLALLLPMAQSAASWHMLAHATANAADDDGQPGIGHAHCDLCLNAAAVLAGAPQLAVCRPVFACGLHQTAPKATPVSFWATPTTAYNSRAPPSFQH